MDPKKKSVVVISYLATVPRSNLLLDAVSNFRGLPAPLFFCTDEFLDPRFFVNLPDSSFWDERCSTTKWPLTETATATAHCKCKHIPKRPRDSAYNFVTFEFKNFVADDYRAKSDNAKRERKKKRGRVTTLTVRKKRRGTQQK